MNCDKKCENIAGIRITDQSCFYDASTFAKTKLLIDAELAKSREDFIEHFHNTYSDPYPSLTYCDKRIIFSGEKERNCRFICIFARFFISLQP